MEINSKKIIIISIVTILIAVSLIILYSIFGKETTTIYVPFSDYTKITNIKEKLNNKDSYNEIVDILQTSKYFSSLPRINNYNKESFNKDNIEPLLYVYLSNFNKNNKSVFTEEFQKNNIYCINKNDFLLSFKELANINISNYYNLIKAYYPKAIYKKNNDYCLNFNSEILETDSGSMIGIESLIVDDNNVITVRLYFYDYNLVGEEDSEYTKFETNLKNYIKNKDFIMANSIFEEYLLYSPVHYEMRFKINNDAKFFKYQIISNKII